MNRHHLRAGFARLSFNFMPFGMLKFMGEHLILLSSFQTVLVTLTVKGSFISMYAKFSEKLKF